MNKGTVLWYNNEKKYGFITPEAKEDEEVSDIYFNQNSLIDRYFPPLAGYRVAYGIIIQKDGRKCAIHVKAIEDEK